MPRVNPSVKRTPHADNTDTKPILKWAGGKQQLLPQLLSRVPGKFNKYIEPFIGGGALFFALKPGNAIISDSNPDLIHVYQTVATHPDELIRLLDSFKTDKNSFYEIRSQETSSLSPIERAARMIYLNRTCFNGLFRVNKNGQFNVPYGEYKNPKVCFPSELLAASKLLGHSTILYSDYKDVLAQYAQPGDFIYMDPPYLPVSKYSDFKRYTKEQFYEEDHVELAAEVNRLHELGCHVLLTNSNHPLVYDLYEGFNIEVFKTQRKISKDTKNRTGEDVLISIPPKKTFSVLLESPPLNKQVLKYPPTRYMGSKQNILPFIWQAASQFEFDSVLDLFSGSGVVSYLFKSYGKKVISNDFMAMNATFSTAMIENNKVKLSDAELEELFHIPVETDGFVSTRFKGLYFTDEENAWIDYIRTNIMAIRNKYKRAIAMTGLIRAAIKKRPRGIFTYTGERYDDGRPDLKLSFEEQFRNAVKSVNHAVFDNGKKNISRHGDAMSVHQKPGLVYMDPPYYSLFSDNDYVRRYHFVEGLACNWKGVEIQEHTKTRKFKSYPSPFSSRVGVHDAFDKLFQKFRNSIMLISYSSNSLPTKDEMLALLSKYKKNIKVISIDYRYSFANQGHKVSDNNNKVQEYLFVGF